MMELPTDFLAVSLLAAVSVTVGLSSASYDDNAGAAPSGGTGNLVSAVAAVLGLDETQVNNYLQGQRSEISFGAARLRSI